MWTTVGELLEALMFGFWRAGLAHEVVIRELLKVLRSGFWMAGLLEVVVQPLKPQHVMHG